MTNNKKIRFKGLKKNPVLFIFSILFILFLTFLFLVLTPIGWVILTGFYDIFTKEKLFPKILTLIMVMMYFLGILTLTNTICGNSQD